MKYRIESFYCGKWCKIADYVSRQFAQGVLWASKHDAPRLARAVAPAAIGRQRH